LAAFGAANPLKRRGVSVDPPEDDEAAATVRRSAEAAKCRMAENVDGTKKTVVVAKET